MIRQKCFIVKCSTIELPVSRYYEGYMMGNCPTCGASGFFGVSTKQCAWCGKIVCNRCVPNWHGNLVFKTTMEDSFNPPIYDMVEFCSDSCFNRFWLTVCKYPKESIGTNIPNFNNQVMLLWNQAIKDTALKSNPNVSKSLTQKINHAVSLHTPEFTALPCRDPSGKYMWMFERFISKARLTLAQNLERCGRTRDAAVIFEELRMYDKAKELRERDRHIIIKKTDVSVNLNALLQQVKDGGIVAIFRCPHCGGKLKISDKTTVNSLRVCEHCGSQIEAMDLADFLKSALS